MTASESITEQRRQVWLQKDDPEIRIFYIETRPSSGHEKGTILLIHGFPETSYQFRHVMGPLAKAGYRVVAPDYRGAGYSSKPPSGFTKDVLAADLQALLIQHLGVKGGVHVVGHDIGGMIAHAYAAQFPEHVASVIWGECPLPGSKVYDETKHTPTLWHFDFQSQTDMAETLVSGKEKIYLKHFYDRLGQNPQAFLNEDLDFYTSQYAMPGALRCGFTVYESFETDKVHNRDWLNNNGKIVPRAMILSGEHSFIAEVAQGMASEFYKNVKHELVAGAGHWIAEENPVDFIEKVLGFVETRT